MPDKIGESTTNELPRSQMNPWRITSWLCLAVITVSVLACVAMAFSRSTGLIEIKVTALDPAAEPRDHNLPLIKKKEALPDYELMIILSEGGKIRLGSKPDTSAADGLIWQISKPVSIHDIASIRLQEKDKLLSDAIAEVQIRSDSITEKGYRFDFTSQRSAEVGITSFFNTPIGKAICAGFVIAVVVIILSVFRV